MDRNIELQVALQELWDVIKKMALKIESFHKKRNELQSQIDFLDSTIVLKNNKIKELEEQTAKFQKAINEKNERITSQYSEIDSLLAKQEKSTDLEQLYFDAANENEMLKKDLAVLTDKSIKLDRLENEYNELKTIKNKLEIENVELNEKTGILDNVLKNNEIAQNEIKSIRREIINRNDQINQLKINLSERESTIISKNNELKQLLNESSNFNNKTVTLQAEVAKCNTTIKTLEEDFMHKEMVLESDKLTYVAIIEHLKHEISDLDKQKQMSVQASTTQKDNDAKLLELLNDNAILQQELTETKRQNKTLYTEIDTLKQQVLTYNVDFREDNKTNKNEIREIIAEAERLTEMVSVLTDEIENNKTDSQHIYLENEQLKAQIVSLQNDIDKVSKLSKAIERIKRTNKEQESTIFELQVELTSYKRRMYDEDSLFADMHKLEFIDNAEQHKLELAQLSQKNTELENKNNELAKRVNELEHKELEFIRINKNKEQLVVNKKTEIDKKEDVVNKISSFLDKLEQRI